MSGLSVRARRLDGSENIDIAITTFRKVELMKSFLDEMFEEEGVEVSLTISTIRDYDGFATGAVLLLISAWSTFSEWLAKADLDKLGSCVQGEYDVGAENIINLLQPLREEKVLWDKYSHNDCLELEFIYN